MCSNHTGGVTKHTAASGVLPSCRFYFGGFVSSVEIRQNPCKPVHTLQYFTQISPERRLAASRATWLDDLSKGFKRHRRGRPGWNIEHKRDKLRLVSSEFPPRPDEPQSDKPKRRALTLSAPPGSATSLQAATEAANVFDAVLAGTFNWPDPDGLDADNPTHLAPKAIKALVTQLKGDVLNEKVIERTWDKTYQPYFDKLIAIAGQKYWATDFELLDTVLRHWKVNTRARQIAHDKYRRLWKQAKWSWPDEIRKMRGNGNAAKPVDGVKGFRDHEIDELRLRIQASNRLTEADLVAWDVLQVFGLRPKELQFFTLYEEDGELIAKVLRETASIKGKEGFRLVGAAPPSSWPLDCNGLLKRWKKHGIPKTMLDKVSPSEVLVDQLKRLIKPARKITCDIDPDLTPMGGRHGFVVRIHTDFNLSTKEGADLCGHSEMVHLSAYGQVLDRPKTLAKMRRGPN